MPASANLHASVYGRHSNPSVWIIKYQHFANCLILDCLSPVWATNTSGQSHRLPRNNLDAWFIFDHASSNSHKYEVSNAFSEEQSQLSCVTTVFGPDPGDCLAAVPWSEHSLTSTRLRVIHSLCPVTSQVRQSRQIDYENHHVCKLFNGRAWKMFFDL